MEMYPCQKAFIKNVRIHDEKTLCCTCAITDLKLVIDCEYIDQNNIDIELNHHIPKICEVGCKYVIGADPELFTMEVLEIDGQ